MKTHITPWLVGLATLMTACEASTYQVSGTAKGFADGYKLYLTTDVKEGKPTDSLYIDKECFEYKGIADSMHLAMLFSPSDPYAQQLFFAEPGSKIAISLSQTPGMSRVSGTKANDDFQMISDSAMSMNHRLERLFAQYGEMPTDEQQQEMEKVSMTEAGRLTGILYQTAERHIDDEFGYFLTTQPDLFDDESLMKLINQMPLQFRQRELIKEIENTIKTMSGTGNTIPDMTLPDMEGNLVAIAEEIAKHKVTVIDFWASWCRPCMEEMPHLVQLYNLYRSHGMGIIGISLDKDAEAWKNAVAEQHADWQHLSDLKYWDSAPVKLLGIKAIPHTIIVDQEGKILGKGLIGVQLEDFLRNLGLDER